MKRRCTAMSNSVSLGVHALETELAIFAFTNELQGPKLLTFDRIVVLDQDVYDGRNGSTS